MSKCELCGESHSGVQKCKVCHIMFCEYCGSKKDMLCVNCLETDIYSELIEREILPKSHSFGFWMSSYYYDPSNGGGIQ